MDRFDEAEPLSSNVLRFWSMVSQPLVDLYATMQALPDLSSEDFASGVCVRVNVCVSVLCVCVCMCVYIFSYACVCVCVFGSVFCLCLELCFNECE